MINTGKYDKIAIGAGAGFILPVIISLLFYLFSSGDQTLSGYFVRIVTANILTHVISLCVFSNLFLFLVFNRLDMLQATRGVLGITIFWALVVFAIKFLV
jgi:hypothetical protein